MSELSEVSIDWKMLTIARPEKKLDELFYSQYDYWLPDPTFNFYVKIDKSDKTINQDKKR